jgi:uncharacterized protein DUF3800
MAIFTAYFDESGTPDESPFVVVAGYLASVNEWRQFNDRWGRVLTEYGVPYFHVKEYAHSRGAFESWKGQERKRKRFARGLTSQIRRSVRAGFAAIVDVSDWRRANHRYELDTPGLEGGLACYPLCGKLCVELVRVWCENHRFPLGGVEFVFHNGAKDKGKLIRRLEIDHGITPIFDPRSTGNFPVPGVQAADFLASENGKHAPEIALKHFDREPRKSFVRLVLGVHTRTLFCNYDWIEKLALSAGLPTRSSPPPI